jgi:thymidine phosphorylase
VGGIDTRALGIVVVALGGGRTRPEDGIDPAVGLSRLARIGEPIGPERPLALVHAGDERAFEAAAAGIRLAYAIHEIDTAEASAPIVLETITA